MTTNYLYDGLGERVEDTVLPRLFWYGAGGELLEASDGASKFDWIYFAGQRIARHDSASGGVYYFYDDGLGSQRVMTYASGAVYSEADFYPFGELLWLVGSRGDNFVFAGQYTDEAGEDGGNNTLYRRYQDDWGRWLSPDPLGGEVLNPQSLNRYAYVMNNPASMTDPLGLDSVWWCGPGKYSISVDYGSPVCSWPIGAGIGPFPGPPIIVGWAGGGGGGSPSGGTGTSSAGTSGGPPPGSASGIESTGTLGGPIIWGWPWLIRITSWGWPYIVEGVGLGGALGLAILQQSDAAPQAIRDRAKPQPKPVPVAPTQTQPQSGESTFPQELCTLREQFYDPAVSDKRLCSYSCPTKGNVIIFVHGSQQCPNPLLW